VSYNERRKLLSDLESRRGSLIISMVYSRHAWMSTDDATLVYEVLSHSLRSRKVERVERIEIVLDSLGGEAAAAYKIVNVARMFAEELNVIVVEKAKSAATLLALGSDKIYMTRFAELGPIDPIVSHPIMTNIMIPARAVQMFIDNVLPLLLEKYGPSIADYFMKIDYNHIGFCRAAMKEAEEYAKLLLRKYHMRGKPSSEIEETVKKLLSYPSHDFVIGFEEARDMGLNIELLKPDEEDLVWRLYREYGRSLDDVVLIVETKEYSREVKRPKVTIW